MRSARRGRSNGTATPEFIRADGVDSAAPVRQGDDNYGEGSSREHAALSPRLLALSFADPADYERISEDDRISLIGLADLAPATPVDARVAHADGIIEVIRLNHAYSAS
jgi:aconitate hydratase